MFRKFLVPLACLALAHGVRAQCLEWGTQFSWPGGGVDGIVRTSAVYDDGSGPALYLGGEFTHASVDLPANRVVRWDGSAFSALGAGLDGPVWSLFVFDDGSGSALYAAGDFSGFIARWDGALWSSPGGGLGAPAYALCAFDDGSGPALFAAGEFSGFIARWDGALWSSPGGGLDAPAYALAAYDDGGGAALFAGGAFTQAGGAPASRIARWDGANWSALGAGVGSTVSALEPYALAGGPVQLYVAGSFTSAGGQPANNLARWDGASLSGAGLGCNAPVFALHVHAGALYVGGNFTNAGGTTAVSIARYDGSWSAVGTGPGATVFDFASFDSGSGPELYACGGFALWNGPTNRVARWDGTNWNVLAPGHGVANSVTALTTYDDGSGPALYAAGIFQRAGGTSANRIARWTGSDWVALGNGIPCCNPYVLRGYDDGTGRALYAGGDFGIQRWRAGAWSVVGAGLGGVKDLAVFDDGTGPALYAVGFFGGHIARWDGTSWSTVGGGIPSTTSGVCVFDDGSGPALYVTGGFTMAGGVPCSRIAKWDGVSWSALGSGLNSTGFTLEVFDDGTGSALYVGGYFTFAGGFPAQHFARWSGTSWSNLGWGTPGPVHDMLGFDDGTGPALYLAGDNQVLRWRAGGGGAVGSGAPGPCEKLAIFDDGRGGGPDLYVGGVFNVAGGHQSWNLATWLGCQGPATLYCFGDGASAPCPCANSGLAGRGCQNSAGTGGAQMLASGTTNPDSMVLTTSGETPSAISIVLQGDATVAPAAFGDGLRCAGGLLKRLYVKTAVAGVVVAPQAGDPSISARSAALGDPIPPGGARYYVTYYRDGAGSFCPPPAGSTYNASNGAAITW